MRYNTVGTTFFVLSQNMSLTDVQTDGQTDRPTAFSWLNRICMQRGEKKGSSSAFIMVFRHTCRAA